MDESFGRGPARRPLPVVQDVLFQWATGLQTTSRSVYAGWFVQTGKDADLDAAMRDLGYQQVTIKHTGGPATHWDIGSVSLFIVADGVQSLQEIRTTDERFGIAVWWSKHPQTGRNQSNLRARVFLRPLLEIGYTKPLMVSLKGTLTSDFLTALMTQYEVLDAIDAFRKESGKPALNPPFYACSIPLGPGKDVSRGSSGQTKEITPIVSLVPSPVNKDHVMNEWIKREWKPLIEDMIDQTVMWSTRISHDGAAGTLNEQQSDDLV